MKRIHYVHFGNQRSGSTWLYHNLMKHPAVDYRGEKESQFLFEHSQDIIGYNKRFSEFEISMNFNPLNWALDSAQLSILSKVATHCSICFRNPYDMLDSWYNFVDIRPNNFVDRYIELNFVNYTKTLTRLDSYVDLAVLVFDDLEADPQRFLNTVTQNLGLTNIEHTYNISIANKKKSNDHLLYTDAQIKTINSGIDDFSAHIHRDLSHWKKK